MVDKIGEMIDNLVMRNSIVSENEIRRGSSVANFDEVLLKMAEEERQ